MSAHAQQQQLFQDFKASIEAPIRRHYQQKIDGLRDELADARAEIRDLRILSFPKTFQNNLAAVHETSMSQESNDSSSERDQNLLRGVAPSIDQDHDSDSPTPSEETLRRYATTIAYSTYSTLCGTSDHELIQLLVENDLQEPHISLGPKKMIDISRTEHNIAYLRENIGEGSSLFAARMIQARGLIYPEVTTNDQVRRLGPANVPEEKLPIYWIVTFSNHGVVTWEEGCRLAGAYRRVFEEFGVDDVHCLVFESETSLPGTEFQTAYTME
ncbi:hypothetical protein J7T55_004928 [Diaporthe amygdali]|uniref:uncharacterized protein n=1 Tax=Phomopsis amygdali TaxID=1214568 RepID=UPI0022FEE12D|nr:uncharacterized protein J7T55_004928 [Diaporthe amygdali]KAJ0114684.1 hypothetical protein J7T55_004928 [Diaporthe amygdali]